MTQPDRLQAYIAELVAAAIEREIVQGDALVYFAEWLYQVVEVHAGSPVTYDLRSTDPRLPDIQGAALWPGPSGASAQAKAGTQVRVRFANADRTRPMIVGLDPNAVDTVTMPGDVSVLLGDSPRDFVALASKVAALQSDYNGHKHTGVQTGSGTSGITDTINSTNFASPTVKATAP